MHVIQILLPLKERAKKRKEKKTESHPSSLFPDSPSLTPSFPLLGVWLETDPTGSPWWSAGETRMRGEEEKKRKEEWEAHLLAQLSAGSGKGSGWRQPLIG